MQGEWGWRHTRINTSANRCHHFHHTPAERGISGTHREGGWLDSRHVEVKGQVSVPEGNWIPVVHLIPSHFTIWAIWLQFYNTRTLNKTVGHNCVHLYWFLVSLRDINVILGVFLSYYFPCAVHFYGIITHDKVEFERILVDFQLKCAE
jgi:hypothetical protein